ncbi:MAG: response regulator [Candidatus Micrarchaeota archaeon]
MITGPSSLPPRLFSPENERGVGFSGRKPEPDSVDAGGVKKHFTILVVDDTEPLLRAAARILKGNGFTILTAADGVQALAAFGKERIDLVVSDRQMPNMGGLDLLRSLKAIDPKVKFILMSGNISDTDTLEFLMEGALDVLHKPVDAAVLKASVERCLLGDVPAVTAQGPKNGNEVRIGEGTKRQLRVLVVDDDPDNLFGEEAILQAILGCSVKTAISGKEAAEIFLREGADAIVTDFHMENGDGAFLAAEVRKSGSKVPIILVSGEADEKEKQRALDCGVNLILRKPVDPIERLTDAIVKLTSG